MIPYKPMPVLNFGILDIGMAPLMSTIGFLVFGILVAREFKKTGMKLDRNQFLLFILLLIISSLAGGRIWYFAENWQGLKTLPIIFNLFIPGLTSYGMIAGGLLFLIMWAKKNPVKGMGFSPQLARLADCVCLYVPIFVAIYRVGCLFHGCCFGARTNVPWALHYLGTNINRHPSPVYEIISALIIFALLKIFLGRKKTKKTMFGQRFDGEIALWFLLLYGIGRFVTDFFRYYQHHYLGLAGSQIICMWTIFLITIYLFLEYLFIGSKHITNYRDYYNILKKEKILYGSKYIFMRKFKK